MQVVLSDLLTLVAVVPADLAVLTGLGFTSVAAATYIGLIPALVFDPTQGKFALITANKFWNKNILATTTFRMSFNEELQSILPTFSYGPRTTLLADNYYELNFDSEAGAGAIAVDSTNNSSTALLYPIGTSGDISTIYKCTKYYQDRSSLSCFQTCKRIVVTTTMPISTQVMPSPVPFGTVGDTTTITTNTLQVLCDFEVAPDDETGVPTTELSYVPMNIKWIDVHPGVPINKLDCKFWWMDTYSNLHPLKLLMGRGFSMIVNFKKLF
jgi:hypothetical protein